MTYCCACNDIRPMQATYIAHNKPYLSQGSYVSRNHYYCPTCKMAPSPVKIDFSKMKPKPASDPALFQPSVKEDIEVLKKQNQELRHEIEALTAEINELNTRNCVLTQRIRDPFKSAMSRPNF
jgi:predicted nucleotide-binding protein (sugar kinase/HSP70/actin superfamily)